MDNEQLQNWCNAGIALFGVLAALCGYGSYHFGKAIDKEKEAKEARSGVLTMPKKNKVPFVFQKTEPREFVIRLGGSVFTTSSPLDEHKKLFEFEGIPLDIRFNRHQLLLKGDFYNYKKELVAQMIDNEWQVGQLGVTTWDRNYNNNCLEIKNSEGDIILQVIYGEKFIDLQTKMYSPNRDTGLLIANSEPFAGANNGATKEQMDKVKFDPIFKYPSDRHFGELTDVGKKILNEQK